MEKISLLFTNSNDITGIEDADYQGVLKGLPKCGAPKACFGLWQSATYVHIFPIEAYSVGKAGSYMTSAS